MLTLIAYIFFSSVAQEGLNILLGDDLTLVNGVS